MQQLFDDTQVGNTKLLSNMNQPTSWLAIVTEVFYTNM